MFSKTVVAAFVLTVIAFAIFPVNEVEAEEYVTRDLIGYWTMDKANIDGQIVKDISGNKNHGVIIGNPQTVRGIIGEALDFDGVDDFVALPNLGHEPEVTVEVCGERRSAFSGPWAGFQFSYPRSDAGKRRDLQR